MSKSTTTVLEIYKNTNNGPFNTTVFCSTAISKTTLSTVVRQLQTTCSQRQLSSCEYHLRSDRHNCFTVAAQFHHQPPRSHRIFWECKKYTNMSCILLFSKTSDIHLCLWIRVSWWYFSCLQGASEKCGSTFFYKSNVFLLPDQRHWSTKGKAQSSKTLTDKTANRLVRENAASLSNNFAWWQHVHNACKNHTSVPMKAKMFLDLFCGSFTLHIITQPTVLKQWWKTKQWSRPLKITHSCHLFLSTSRRLLDRAKLHLYDADIELKQANTVQHCDTTAW